MNSIPFFAQLDLSAGNYTITASADNRVRVMPRTNQRDISTRITTNLTGTRATVRVAGPKRGFDAEIQLPARVGVIVKMASGSLRLSGIEGSKEINADAANVEIALGNRDLYRQVTASVGKGELAAPAFNEHARGSGTMRWTGTGRYDVRVELKAGRVALTQ